MKKSERINDLMIYLNNRNSFNLRDIMDRYHISKSTALRDIQSLEAIGMPIYSEQGRNGKYILLNNRLLSPIIFTLDEMIAMYFAMKTLDAYQSTPFHMSLDRLKDKFRSCLSTNQLQRIAKMDKVLQLESYVHPNTSPHLRTILDAITEEHICLITYKKGNQTKSYTVQFYYIGATYGQWYATAYNHKEGNTRVFRCDRIQEIEIQRQPKEPAKPLSILLSMGIEHYKVLGAIDYTVEIKPSAVDHYYKEHYPSMNLINDGDKWFVKGFYNPNERSFIADYFMKYGNAVLSVDPPELKVLILHAINTTVKHYVKL